ncbi:uncharacterized protein LOC111700331 [Eurytemora carolleeae]|uniref:uncharacterized protein LOC111700331 n=1 Tax=Eurytemora carolleeae TaxID=1294199 RepID=UPI000C79000A|nr:uncharacterized protein LOC111700331 [Eurytemora carolleeae]|eukprot:XP_023326982.1 uncharacterized protein LOC111700331 [Eurytemora affinis]
MSSNKFYILILCVFLASFIPTGETGGIKCHYCGRSNICKLPYDSDPEEADFITCEKSCMKFDGYNADGGRVVVRDCGIYEASECQADAQYATTEATGTLCHCLLDQCNSVNGLIPSLLTSFFMALVGRIIY